MTADDADVKRLHERLDDVFTELSAQGRQLAELRAEVKASAQQERDMQASRANTCPMNERILLLETSVQQIASIGKWSLGILTVALIVPGIAYAGQRIAELIATH